MQKLKTAIALGQLTPSGPGPSKSFQLLVRAIGEAKTQHEGSDRIIKIESTISKGKNGIKRHECSKLVH